MEGINTVSFQMLLQSLPPWTRRFPLYWFTVKPFSVHWLQILLLVQIGSVMAKGQGVNATNTPGQAPSGMTQQSKPDVQMAYAGLLVTKNEYSNQRVLVKRDLELEEGITRDEHPPIPSNYSSSVKSKYRLMLLGYSLELSVKVLRNVLAAHQGATIDLQERTERNEVMTEALSLLRNETLLSKPGSKSFHH